MSKMKIKKKIKKVKSQIESISHWSVRCTAAVQSRLSRSQFKEINLGWIRANLLNLNPLIPDKPVCSPDQKKIYGVARGEMVAVNCSVNANPGTHSLTRTP